MKKLTLNQYDREMYEILERWNERQKKKRQNNGLTAENTKSLNLNSLEFQIHEWNRWKALCSFLILEQAGLCEVISRNKVRLKKRRKK